MCKNLYFVYRPKHWIILKQLIINLFKKLSEWKWLFRFKTLLLFPRSSCYFCTLCFFFLAIVIWILLLYLVSGKRLLLTSMTATGNLFNNVWNGRRLFCIWFIRNYLPGEMPFLSASLKNWPSVSKFTLEKNTKFKNIATMFGAKQFVYANIFLQFLNNFHHGHSMHYHHHTLTVLFENCYPFTERKHTSRCHSYKKIKNETKLSVIWRKQIKSMKTQQLTFNPYHPKLGEGQQQLKSFVSVLKKSKTCLIWSKMRIHLMMLWATWQA